MSCCVVPIPCAAYVCCSNAFGVKTGWERPFGERGCDIDRCDGCA